MAAQTRKGLMILGIVIALGWLVLDFWMWSLRPIYLIDEKDFRLASGERLSTLSERLEQEGLINSPWRFNLFVKIKGNYRQFVAGNYRFSRGVTPEVIVEAMALGKTHPLLTLEVVIPEGWTLKQIDERLVELKVGKSGELLALNKDTSFLSEFSLPYLEGFIYPETYQYFEEMPTVAGFAKSAVKEFFKRLPKDYEQKLRGRGLRLPEAVTFASLVERETKWSDERRKVSEVIWNRLKKNMTLGIDAALIYGIRDYRGDITSEHLKDAKNLYNTRIHKGLPPTPIGSVSMASLEAVLTPTEEGYFYFVAQPNGFGRHQFTRNISDHEKKVKELVKYQKTNSH